VAAQASFQVLSHWRTVARLHEDGMEKANRQLQEGMHFNPDERVSPEAIDAYLRAILAVFDAFYEAHDGEFSANLTVPNAGRTALWLVRIEPGGGGRSNNVPRQIDLADDEWGAAVAFRSGRLVFTPDVRLHGNGGDRGYLSVVNIPVLGSHGEVVATVNVDSPHAGAFGSEERVSSVWAYCLPVLSSLSLCLNDVRLFRDERR
jgi:hypothetical protein